MSKHTPGPWEAHDEGCNCLFIRGQVPVNEGATSRERQYYSSIATVTQRDSHPRLGGGIDRSVTAANARLIAAAPELLELAECFQAVCARVIEQYGAVHFGVDFAALGGSVNRVIAKATGEQA